MTMRLVAVIAATLRAAPKPARAGSMIGKSL
jgi:hypothetical protein